MMLMSPESLAVQRPSQNAIIVPVGAKGGFIVKSAAGNVERALYQGLVLSGLIAARA
jgi:hypothetical protein